TMIMWFRSDLGCRPSPQSMPGLGSRRVLSGVDMDGRGSEPRQRLPERPADVLPDLVADPGRQLTVDDHAELGVKSVPHPAGAHLAHRLDGRDAERGGLDGRGDLRV